jgi:hypothetical protein
MKSLKSLFVGIIICLSVISCDKEDGNPDNIEITGTIQEQGMTTYQY